MRTLFCLAFACCAMFSMPGMAQQGDLDPTFNPIDTGNYGAYGASNVTQCVLLQPDEKIIIGGHFTAYNGVPRLFLARLDEDGALDNGFATGAGPDNAVRHVALQPDGKLIITGQFNTYDGTPRNRIARLNTDGSLDAGFDPGDGPDATIEAICVQPDGRILIGGNFTDYDGTPRGKVARLNADGSLDASFDPGTGAANGSVQTLAIQPDGMIIVGGNFDALNGIPRGRIGRLNADGSVDPGFATGAGGDSDIERVVVRMDGTILISGSFEEFDGISRNRIARLEMDGSLDLVFDPGTAADHQITSLIEQPDGRIMVGGVFQNYNGQPIQKLARLTADGALDLSFDPGTGPSSNLHAMAQQPTGDIIIVGGFTSYNGTGRNRVARVYGEIMGNSVSGVSGSASGWGVRPNPATDRIDVSAPLAAAIQEARVFDALGRCVGTYRGAAARQLNISSLPSGPYVLEVCSTLATERLRFVKE